MLARTGPVPISTKTLENKGNRRAQLPKTVQKRFPPRTGGGTAEYAKYAK